MSVAATAIAQTAEPLSPLIVEGRQIEEKLSAELAEYGHQVVVIQGEDILKQGYSDINEALAKMVPGLIIVPKSRGDYTNFWMNGNRNILWLMDGVRLNNRLYGSAYVDTIGIHMIDRVEVLIGGEGLFYGTDSSSGVVNVITKKATEYLSGEIGGAVGTKGFHDSWATISAGIGRHRFLLSAAYDAWDGFLPFEARRYEIASNRDPVKRGYDRSNITLKYETELHLEGNNSLSVSIARNDGAFPNLGVANHINVNHRLEHVGILKWDHDVTPNYSYYLKGYFHSWWTKYDVQNLQYQWTSWKKVWGYEDWGINFLNSLRFDAGHELLFGYEFQSYWAKDYFLVILPQHEQVHAVFAQFRPKFSFWEGWNLALGARYNFTNVQDSFIWNVSSKMPILGDDRLFLRANIGTSFILPNAEQLHADQPTYRGNPDLKPQSSLSATVGLSSYTEMFDFDLGVFLERVTNRMFLDTQTPKRVFQNAGRSEIRGGIISVKARPVAGLALSASFIKQGAEEVSNLGVKTHRISGQPNEFLKLGMQYDGEFGGGQKFGIGIYSTWMGHVYGNYSQLGGWVSYGDYWLADANLYYKPVDSVRITLSLSNVFDTQYSTGTPTYTADPESPQGYRLFANPLGAPFTATLGVSYSF
jgi:vitamin B12 transporter